MNSNTDKESYAYLGIQARPPRRNGRDRKRLNKGQVDQSVEEDREIDVQQEKKEEVTDPLSPYVEE